MWSWITADDVVLMHVFMNSISVDNVVGTVCISTYCSWSCVHVIHYHIFLWPDLICCLIQFCWGWNFSCWWIQTKGMLLLKGAVPLASRACGCAAGTQKAAQTELEAQTIQKKTWLIFLWISSLIGLAVHLLDLMQGDGCTYMGGHCREQATVRLG